MIRISQNFFRLFIAITLLFGSAISYASHSEQYAGELEIIQIDYPDERPSELIYGLRVANSRRPIPLVFNNNKPDFPLTSGQQVRVHGRGLAKGIEVDSLVLAVDGTNPDGTTTVEAVTTEAQRAIVMMVDFQDVKASSRYSISQITGQMYTNTRSVDGVMRASSYNQISFEPDTDGDGAADVFGPFNINFNAGDSCDYYGWANAAENAATASGIDLSLYKYRVFVLPRYNDLPRCGWAGLGNLGCGSFCRSWIAEGESGMVYAHELGHNISWHHSGVDPENDGTVNNEYGDYSGIMGSNRSWHQVNAPHRDQLNWFAPYPDSLVNVVDGGVYDLSALEIDPATGTTGAQVLKIAKPDSNDFYYVSYRRASGSFGASTTYADKISIHRYRGSGAVVTSLVKVLGQDGVFTDNANGITIAALSVGTANASVQVSFECANLSPTVSMSPASQLGANGTTLNYTVNITNRDASNCGNGTFSLNGALAAGFSGNFSASSVTLAPGASTTVNWAITANSASDGNHNHSLTVSEAGRPSSSATATYQIDATAPSAPGNLSASVKRKTQVVLSWNASTDNATGISQYRILRDGALIATHGSNGYTDRNTVSGATHSYQIEAVDGAGNISAGSNVISITVGGKTTGGGGGDTTDGGTGGGGNKGGGKGGGKKK